ncbi:MAG: CtsR family transcriptional regulator [Clostridiales bacterium]|nr:CtsR family transcriptional regulator [Clostridiales bacterium]
MGISDRIEAFITELMKSDMEDDWLELKRNELASVFGCAPSQINYVISTRFSPQRGYAVESKRGGGGYVRIRRIDSTKENPVYEVIREIGGGIDYPTARNYVLYLTDKGAVSDEAARLILSAVSDNALGTAAQKDMIRASIMKNMLSAII